jgi:exodeoxyribonuclease V alpha subunit
MVVIDEASMVGLPSFHALLRHMPEGARLLLVGDGGQLPPVEFGLVFHKLVKDPALTYTLIQVHRQAMETGIPDAGAKVRKGQLPDFTPYQGRTKGVSLVPADPRKLASTVEEIALSLGGYQNGVMIVTPTKSRDAGVRELNANLHLKFVSGGNVPCVHGFRHESFSVGEPVMFLRNDYKRGLFNGLLGQVEALTEQGGLRVKFDGQAQSEELVAADLLDLTPAYAITCHKMQGSQVPVVVVPLYKTGLLDPSWIYTAISRAVEQCIFVGPAEVLKEGLSQPCVADQRLVGFEWV